MAKKRRDRERDDSSAIKVAKLGRAALAIGASAALFNRSGLQGEFSSKLIRTTKNTSKALHRDFSGKKVTASLIKESYDKRIGKDFNKLKKEFNNVDTRIELRTHGNKTLLSKQRNIESNSRSEIDKTIKQIKHNRTKTEIINNLTDKYGKDKQKGIQQIVFNGYENIEQHSKNVGGINTFNEDYFKKTFNKFNFSDNERDDILNHILEKKNVAREQMPLFENRKDIIELKKNIASKLESEQKSNQNFISKLIQDKTGIDIEEAFYGSKAMTYNDFKEYYRDNKDAFNDDTLNKIKVSVNKKDRNIESIDLLESLERRLSEDKDFGNQIFDKNIRVKKSSDGIIEQVYSTHEMSDLINNSLKKFSSTFPGRLFKGIDVWQHYNEQPMLKLLGSGKIGTQTFRDGGNLLTRDRINIGKGLWDIIDNNDVISLSEEAVDVGGRLISNQYGSQARILQDMLGTNQVSIGSDDNPLLKLLDINQTGHRNNFSKIKGFIKKEESIEDNSLKMLSSLFDYGETDILNLQDKINIMSWNRGVSETDIASEILEDSKFLNDIMNRYTNNNRISNGAINNLLETDISDRSKHILTKIQELDASTNYDEFFDSLTNVDGEGLKFKNADMNNLYRKYQSNIEDFLSLKNISTKSGIEIPLMDMELSSTNLLDINDIVKRELLKEVLLTEAEKNSDNISHILTQANLTNKDRQGLGYLLNWGLYQTKTNLANDKDAYLTIDNMFNASSGLSQFNDYLESDQRIKTSFIEMISELSDEYSGVIKGSSKSINERYASEFNQFDYIRESNWTKIGRSIAQGQIEEINSDILKTAFKELIAGKHDLENITTATMFVQNSINRLNYGLDGTGFELSSQSLSSPVDALKNITLKRLLPIAGAIALYDYADYESENLTGVSVTGALANSARNIDMLGRKVAYGTGVGQTLDYLKQSSVLGEYWTDSTEFQTEEERQEWYNDGYSAVRSGRFWSFGSSSEFRGSGIQYYQPNYLKRAHSNYNEVGIYGSAEEKFKHSWLPSLRHPLSPIRAALDPYWLEKKNIDERPYPLTGKMFSEGTAWGAILNPTVGEILKPVRMLPEVKLRLGNDGRDIRNVVESINARIKQRGSNDNEDMFIVSGTDIRTSTYVPYGSPNSGEINLSFNNGRINSSGFKTINNEVKNINEYTTPNGYTYIDENTTVQGGAHNNDMVQTISNEDKKTGMFVNEMISSINSAIKTIGSGGRVNYLNKGYSRSNSPIPNLENGTYVYTNYNSKKNAANKNYYGSINDPYLVDKSYANDLLRDTKHSMQQLGGMYGFLTEQVLGETSWSMRYQNAGQMSSFTRGFWDANVGGLGGGTMEIFRRFFPSEDKSRLNYNPLQNNMPDWLPEKFRNGDAFASLPKGEMRLPGKGYETLNELNSDSYGIYGAYDRFKILGDIAPTSEEFKIWRNIARNTVTDPYLVKQMDEIEHRANKMGTKHDFYEYKYVNTQTDYNKGVVKDIDNNTGIVTMADGTQISLAGIDLNKSEEEYNNGGRLTDILNSGDVVTYRTSSNAIKRLEDGVVTSGIIYKNDPMPFSSININKQLIDIGGATKKKYDNSSLGGLATISATQEILGGLQELLAHAQIPFIHNKLMKVETAFESYKNEQFYGTPFATWNNPIQGFVNPMLNKTFGQSIPQHALAIGSVALHYGIGVNAKTNQKGLKFATGALMSTLNPSAMLGGAAGWTLRLNNGKQAGQTLSAFDNGAKYGAAIGTIGWGLANADNPLKAAGSFALAGATLASKLETNKLWDDFGSGKGAMIGAAIGLGISALKNPSFDKDKMFGVWTPKSRKDKWEIDEYFDRLEYIKNQGLYKQAVLRASIFEGSNIGNIFKELDKNKKKIAKLERKADEISNKYIGGTYKYNEEIENIQSQILSLQETQKQAYKGGKHTKAAITYKKAMESTIYGLSESATVDEIMASIPEQYKDHFKAFMNERDKNKRKEILKYIPDYLQRSLQIAWRENPNKVDSNNKYFKSHKLPGMSWKGWKPNINIRNVKMKTIENEGMLLSDFGFYESEKAQSSYHLAPDINKGQYDKGETGLSYYTNMLTSMNGMGLMINKINVEPTSVPGVTIVSDINQGYADTKKIVGYGVNSGLQSLVSALF